MILRVIASLLLVLLLIPGGLGCLLVPSRDRRLVLLGGYCASLAVFEVFQLVFHVTAGSLRLMTLLWCVLCAALAVWGYARHGREVWRGGYKLPKLTRIEWLLFALGAAVVVALTLNTVLNTYYGNWDDETYCANAVASWYSDLVNRHNPNMGLLQDAFYDKKYTVAGWPIYSSMLAVLTGLHPAIVYRTILPLFELPLACYAGWLIVRHIFRENRTKALLAFLYLQLFMIAAAETVGGATNEWWQVVDIWSGKALAFNIVSPLVLWLLFEIEDCTDQAKHRALWRVLFLVCCACSLIAASLYMTVPVELALWGGLYLLRTRRWRDLRGFVACGIPLVICAVFVKI